jgi:hypothetical protein
MNTKAPYELPRTFHLDILLSLATAKRDEAHDSIWELRQDPLCFREVVEEEWVLFQESTRKAHAVGGHKLPENFSHQYLGASCRNIIEEAYTRLIMWDTILAELSLLSRLRRNLTAEQLKGYSWELLYKEALEKFTLLFSDIFDMALSQLSAKAAMSGLLQKHFDFVLQGINTTSILRNLDFKKWPPVLVQLCELLNGEHRAMMGAPKPLDELEHTMRTEPSQAALVSPTATSRLSDVAAFAEIEISLQRHRPLIWPRKEIGKKTDFQIAVNNLMIFMGSISDVELADHIVPLAQFAYPYHRRPLQQHVETMRTAEAKLDAVWAYIDDEFRQIGKFGATLHDMLGPVVTPRVLHRTPAWQEPQLPELSPQIPDPQKLRSS